MKSLIASASLILGLLPLGFGIGLAHAQEAPTDAKKAPLHPRQAMEGKDLFRQYCAVCHGTAGKGNGPAASALRTPPSDLTEISRKNGGKFPELRVQQIITGEADAPSAHGSKDMPVWGDLFRNTGTTRDLAAARVSNLTKYLQEIQAK